MSEPISTPTADDIRDLAVRNFERYRQIARPVGAILVAIGVMLFVLELTEFPHAYEMRSAFWYFAVRQLTCTMGLILLGQAYLWPRFFPIYRKPLNAADSKEYRMFLYGWGRPMREQLGETLQLGLLVLIPFAVAGLIWLILRWILPEYPSEVTGIMVVVGFGALVAILVISQRYTNTRVDAWYAAHFPADSAPDA